MEDVSTRDQLLSAQPYSPYPRRRGKKRIFAVILIIVGILIFLGTRFFGSSSVEVEQAVNTPTPTEYIFPTDTPTPEIEESPTPDVSSTPTPRPTSSPIDKASGLNRAELAIDVRNGSGVVGAGSKMSDFLKSFGYKISSIGNADNFDYEQVSIVVKSSKSAYLDLLKKDLASQYTVGSTSATLSATSSADAQVIVGK